MNKYSLVCARLWESRKAAEKEVKGLDIPQWLEGLPSMHEAWALPLAEKRGEGKERKEIRRREEGRERREGRRVDAERP